MRAIHRASVFLNHHPQQAWSEFQAFKKSMREPIQAKIFERSFAYMSVDNVNVKRDWLKVTAYCKRLGILAGDFQPNYTNEFVTWDLEPELVTPDEKQVQIAEQQERVKEGKGVLSRAQVA